MADYVRDEVDRLARRQNEIVRRRFDLSRPPPDDADLRAIQQRFDDAYRSVGTAGAPAPLPGEGLGSFRRRLAGGLQRYSPSTRGVDLFALSASELTPIEHTILAETAAAVADRTRGDFDNPDKLREVRVRDDAGREVIEFHGSPLAWMDALAWAARRSVRNFLDPKTGAVRRTARRTIG